MKHYRTLTAWAALTFTAAMLAAAPVRADMSWEETTRVEVEIDGKTSVLSESHESMSLKDNLIRIDEPDQGTARFINFTSRAVVYVSFSGKTYAYLTIPDMIRESTDQRSKIMASLPQREADLERRQGPQRDLMAAQIDAQKKKYELWERPYRVIRTEEEAEVNGVKCLLYKGMAGDEHFQDIWVAKDVEIDPAFKNYYSRNMAQIDKQEYSHLPPVPNIPIRVVTRYGKVTVTTDVKRVSPDKVPAQAFLLPQDLKASPYVVPGQ